MKNKRIVLFVSIMFVLLTALVFLLSRTSVKETDINVILESSSYAYLPKSAKNYIKEVYEETGEVVLTEKNKKEGQPYLNPMYVSYLELDEEEQKEQGHIPVAVIIDYVENKEDVYGADEIPASYDLRNVSGKNFVTPVRNQGRLGLCWSFATMGSFESHLLKTSNTSYNAATTKKFNERQLDYATANFGIKDYTNSNYSFFVDTELGYRELGSGGNFLVSTIALSNGVSYVDYDWKAYDDQDKEKMELYEVLNYENSQYEVNSTINMPIIDLKDSANSSIKDSYINIIKQYIMQYGGVYVGTLWNNMCNYHDTALNNQVIDVDSYCYTDYDGHAMMIIGWDDNVEYTYCDDYTKHYSVSEKPSCDSYYTGKGAWILKNSWGTGYSDSYPYPYLSYDSLNTEYGMITGVSKTSERNWDNNYNFGDTFDRYVYGTIVGEMADTHIKGQEKLTSVKFIANSQNAVYRITVTGPNGTTSKTVTTTLPGLVTVDFSSTNFIVDSTSKVNVVGQGTYYSFKDFTVFTTNIDETPSTDLSSYNNKKISDNSIRLFSYTKNIPSNGIVSYKFFDSLGNDVTDKLTITKNIVAENNINTLVSGLRNLGFGDHTIEAYYNGSLIGSTVIDNFPMEGKGTAAEPYKIMNSAQLNQVRDNLTAYYILGADIDLTEDTQKGGKLNNLPSPAYDNGHGWEAIIGFQGSFDGKGHTIKGLYQRTKIISKDGQSSSVKTSGYGGLFGRVNRGVKIKNVVLENFDIECHTRCGALVGSYANDGSTNAWNVEFSGIAVKNSVVTGNGDIDLGGVFGSLESNNEASLTINNIYTDTYIDDVTNDISEFGMIAYSIDRFKNVNISNIQMLGFIQGEFDDGSDSAVMIKSLGAHSLTMQNILSTVQSEKVGGLICNECIVNDYNGNDGSWNVKNVNMLQASGYGLFGGVDTKDKITTSNINVVNSSNLISKFTNSSSYSGWSGFSTYWDFKTVDSVNRYPILKVANFEYTKIADIRYNQVLNEYKYIYDYLVPNNNLTNRLSFKSNNEDILKIDSEGKFIPQRDGVAYVNVQSPYYDGYVRNVKVNVDYVPHYTVKFDANGADGEMEQIEVLPNISMVIPNPTFAKNFYDFMGWNTRADGSGITYMPSSTITGVDGDEIILYAQWRGDEFNVTFDAKGGVSPISSKTVYYGDVYGELPIPYKEGYGFNGWAVGSGTYISVDSDDVVYYSDDKRTLMASWNEEEFTVEFKPNGGVGYSDYMSVPVGEDTVLKDNHYTRKSYNFVGWNTEADGSGTNYTDKQVINMTNVTNSILTLYAQWEVIEYEVTFDANGGTGTMEPLIVEAEKEFEISGHTFEREGYSFVGWNTKADGSGNSYGERQFITVDSNITLYAMWNINKYTITFNANDGSGKTTTQEVSWNTETNLNANTFSRNGFEFVNWNTKADGSGESYSNKQAIKTRNNLSLYALWKETYSYKISTYKEGNGVIDNIPIKTNIGTYLSKFNLNTGYSMEVSTVSGYINTGGKLKIYKDGKLYKEFTNIVRGDVNGDARITSADYIKIRKHIMKTEVISNNVYFAAADANQDGKVTSADYVKIRKIIMGG